MSGRSGIRKKQKSNEKKDKKSEGRRRGECLKIGERRKRRGAEGMRKKTRRGTSGGSLNGRSIDKLVRCRRTHAVVLSRSSAPTSCVMKLVFGGRSCSMAISSCQHV